MCTPQEPRHGPVRSYGVAVSYKRGTPGTMLVLNYQLDPGAGGFVDGPIRALLEDFVGSFASGQNLTVLCVPYLLDDCLVCAIFAR